MRQLFLYCVLLRNDYIGSIVRWVGFGWFDLTSDSISDTTKTWECPLVFGENDFRRFYGDFNRRNNGLRSKKKITCVYLTQMSL